MAYWVLFFYAAFALNITPGPDLVCILSRTIAQWRKIGMASSLGVCTGALFHVFAAALGLSAILATSALAFSVIKYAGAAYLLFLGIKAFCSEGTTIEISDTKKTTPSKAFRQGVLIDILNPKVAIFFMAFLPQFVRPELGHTPTHIIMPGALVILTAVVVELGLVIIAGKTTKFFRGNHTISLLLERMLGSIFVGLGIRLAFAGQR